MNIKIIKLDPLQRRLEQANYGLVVEGHIASTETTIEEARKTVCLANRIEFIRECSK